MKRSKSLAVKSRVVRRVVETSSWLRYINESPVTESENYESLEYAYPELQKTRSTRQLRAGLLSRRKLRARLSRLGYRGEQLTSLVQAVAAGGASFHGKTYAGWTQDEALRKFGRRVARELRRGVDARYVFMDEMGYYAYPGFAKLVESMQSLKATRTVNPEAEDLGATELDEQETVLEEEGAPE